MSAFQSLAGMLGLPPLDFDIDEHSRGKIMRASILPFAICVAVSVSLVLDFIYGQFSLLSFAPEFADNPEPWSHLYRFVSGIHSFQWVALAALFLFGIGGWSRGEGAWMLLVGIVLAALSAAFCVYVTGVYFFANSSESLGDLRVFSVGQAATTLGLLAIGYFFLAYRGLTSQPPRRRLRRFGRRRPPATPTSPGD